MSKLIHETAIVDEGAIIGDGTKIWHFCHVMGNAKIGNDCSFGQNVYIGNVDIGSNVKVQNNVSIYDGVTIEDDVFCGPSCVFTNVKNPRSAVNRQGEYSLTLIRRGVSIGANATIVCGVTLGEYSFVGAGSTVTKDTKPYSLNVGSPARQIGWMSKHGQRIDFTEGTYVCVHTNEKYVLKSDNVYIEPSA
jgi:UDP-2-acetamido-3-amino-2,3-dideoxy-glucuronate N-acetyltransferase